MTVLAGGAGHFCQASGKREKHIEFCLQRPSCDAQRSVSAAHSLGSRFQSSPQGSGTDLLSNNTQLAPWSGLFAKTCEKSHNKSQGSIQSSEVDNNMTSFPRALLGRCLWISGVLLLPSFLVDLCDWWPTALNAMLGQLWKYSCGLHYTSPANSNDLKDRRNSYHINVIIGRQIDFRV